MHVKVELGTSFIIQMQVAGVIHSVINSKIREHSVSKADLNIYLWRA